MKSALSIPEIEESRNYWFIRTLGGKWYDDFIAGNYVAIGWNELNLSQINSIKSIKELDKKIKNLYPRQSRNGLTTSQLFRFVFEMTVGDVVVIPSKNSESFAFGIIEGEAYENTIIEADKCDFYKRRKINWVLNIAVNKIDKTLRSIRYTHNTISGLNSYSDFIDRQLNGFAYTKGNLGYMTFNVESSNNIKAQDLADFINSTLDLITLNNPDVYRESIEIRASLNSPGPITYISLAGAIVITAATILSTPKADFSIKATIPNICEIETIANTEGLLNAYSQYKSDEQNRELAKIQAMQEFEIKRKKLEIEIPSEKQINDVNNK